MARYKLKDLSCSKLEYGSGAAACDYDGKVRYVRITDITDDGKLADKIVSPSYYEEKHILQDGDILFARTGATVGKTFLYRNEYGKCVYAGFLIRLVPDISKVLPGFIYYFTKSPRYDNFVENSMKVVAQPNINAQQYGDLEIDVPTFLEQKAIVGKLARIDELIDLRKEQLAKLDELVKARFVEMFGDITEVVPVRNYIKALTAGKSLAGEEECINKVLKTGAATYDEFDASQVKNLPIDYTPDSEHLLKDGDIIISRMNTSELVGATAYVWEAPENTYLPDRLWRAELVPNVNAIFVWQMLIQPSTKDQIRREASGTSGSMKNISKPGLLGIMVKKVPVELQNKFAAFVEQTNKTKLTIQASLDKLEVMKKALMQEYFG